jgi:putative flavoprotein involved in K+ transport
MEHMPVEHVDVVVIGGGQAGLAIGYYLARRGLRFVILEAHTRVGDSWRKRWDSLRLFTFARYDALPGMAFPALPYSFPTKDQMADYLEQYAATFDLPVRTGVHVDALRRAEDGDGYVVIAGDARWLAPQVVVAAGAYHEPRVPDFARELKPDIRQLHSSQYRNPAQLRPGAVLVVGACNSGAEIAFDVAREHRTWLSGRDTGHIPINPGSRAYQVFGHLMSFLGSRLLTVDTPLGRKARPKFRAGGGPLIRVKPVHLRAAGVERVLARTVGTRDGLPLLDDGRVLDVANVIWCVGYEHTARWIEVPIDRDDGWPQQQRGVVPSAPGLYFIGLPFLYSINSSLVVGVERDAAHLADQIVSRAAVSRRVRRGCDMDRGRGSDGMVGSSAVRDDLTSDGR